MRRLSQVGIALEQLANALLGGMADETISARLYRNSGRYWYAKAARLAVDAVLSPVTHDHCLRAWEAEGRREHLPPDYH